MNTRLQSDAADAFRIILGRHPNATEHDELQSELNHDSRQVAFDRLISSPEFRERYFTLVSDAGLLATSVTNHPDALAAVSSDERFVDLVYECFLGRPSDPGGKQHYLDALRSDSRLTVLTNVLRSAEFDVRYVQLAPFVPRDVQLCELANPAKWDNPEWMMLFRDLRILPPERPDMHRKGYELTQLLFGLQRLGRLRDDSSIISVGAGHESVLYWLANHVRRVIASDRYDDEWGRSRGSEGTRHVLSTPAMYAPFPYREDRLSFVRMDGRRLGFADDTFDAAYSLSSIEHFGGFDGAAAAVDEMARIVKPGGLVVVATEYLLSGPRHEQVFEPREVQALFARPRLRLVEPLDDQVYRRYRAMPIDLVRLPYQTPHLVVKIEDTVFTSVIGFLEKQ
jgi:SAM-dependent methyltransferase